MFVKQNHDLNPIPLDDERMAPENNFMPNIRPAAFEVSAQLVEHLLPQLTHNCRRWLERAVCLLLNIFRRHDSVVFAARFATGTGVHLALFALEKRPVAVNLVVAHGKECDDDHYPVEVV